jgi:hypothetical protein
MRTTPTATFYRGLNKGSTDGVWAIYNGTAFNSATTTFALSSSLSSTGFTVVVASFSALTPFSSYLISGHYTTSAEL